jgi:predicted thioesterase
MPPETNHIQPGLSAEVEITVSETKTAAHLGSGSIAVYATPALVALMENAAVLALEGHLPEGQTTVGSHMDVRHLAATPVGMRVRAKAELVKVEGRKLTFLIQAWDETELIGEARHIRFLIVTEKFISKVERKS